MKAPENPRACVYVDLQSWFRASKFYFDVGLPNFNPKKIGQEICQKNKWELVDTNCYLDFPALNITHFWKELWRMRLEDFQTQGMKTWSCLPHVRQALCVDDPPHRVTIRSDAELMIKQSLDIYSDVLRGRVDVVLLFSKENKYIELVNQIKKLAREEDRWIKIVSVFPYQEGLGKKGYAGINYTDWMPINANTYRACSEHIRKPYRNAESETESTESLEDLTREEAEESAPDVASTTVE